MKVRGSEPSSGSEGWDAYAPFYDWENARTLGRRDLPFWKGVLSREGVSTLELGCGTGRLLVDVHLVGEPGARRLLRVSRDGVAGRHAGVLEDYGCVASGFLSLLQATGDATWLELAGELLDDALARFRAEDGGFFDTAADAEALVARYERDFPEQVKR